MRYIFLLLILLSGCFNQSFAQFQEEYRQAQGFIHPVNFFIIDEDKAILFEPLSETDTVTLVDLQNGNVLASIRAGRGPGELSRTSKKIIRRFDHNHVWIWDSGLRRGMVVDNQLDIIHEIEVDNQNLHFAIPISEERVASWTSFSRSILFSVHQLIDYTITEPINTIRYDEFPEYNPVQKNPLSKQGPTIARNEAIYQGYRYSSLILKMDGSGSISYTTGKEQEIGFPEYTSDDGVIEAPDHAEFPQATLSMAVNDEYIFVLHSGRIFDEGWLRSVAHQITGRWEELNIEYDHSDRLLLYNKHSGEFIREVKLPEPAYKIQATNNSFYIYTYLDEPIFIKYKIDF